MRGPFPRLSAMQTGHGWRVWVWLGICLQQAREQGHAAPMYTENICRGGELQGCKTHCGVQPASHKLGERSSKGLRCQRKAVKCLPPSSMSLSFLFCTVLLFGSCNMGHFYISWLLFKGYSYLSTFFLNYINKNFSTNSHPLPDLQMVMHIDICVCPCWFKGVIQIYKKTSRKVTANRIIANNKRCILFNILSKINTC